MVGTSKSNNSLKTTTLNYIRKGLVKPLIKLKESRQLEANYSRKKEARMPKIISKKAKKLRGIKAKLFNKKRFAEKVLIKKTYDFTYFQYQSSRREGCRC